MSPPVPATEDAAGARRLTAGNVADYLRARGLLEPSASVAVTELSGGISNTVLRVDASGGSVVVKQALPELRVSERWEFDPRRTIVEAEAMQALNDLLEPGTTPQVLDLDRDALAFTMTLAPAGGRVWKEALLAGEVDQLVAQRAGTLLGRIHLAAQRADLAERFDDPMPLLEGRINPYHRAAAAANADLAERIETDITRLTACGRTLVLGDYSPKNLIVYPDHVLALDFEVAHWGDPSFDTGFLLTHLLAKAIHRPALTAKLIEAADSFWASYIEAAGSARASEADTAAEVAVLMLCRADGKSRLEYLREPERLRMRELARELVIAEAGDLETVFVCLAEGAR